MSRTEFQQLAGIRLAEARSLLDAGLPNGAYYLAGYAVECALKACIAKNTKRFDFPDKNIVANSYTHDLNQLVGVAALDQLLLNRRKIDTTFRNNWDLVVKWKEHSRYEQKLVDEATALVEAIGHTRNGVLQWIKQHW